MINKLDINGNNGIVFISIIGVIVMFMMYKTIQKFYPLVIIINDMHYFFQLEYYQLPF